MLTFKRVKYTDKITLFLITETIMSFCKDYSSTYVKFSHKGDMYRVLNDDMRTLDNWIDGIESPYIRKLTPRESEWFNKYHAKRFTK